MGKVTPFKIDEAGAHVDRRFAPTLLLLLKHYHWDNGRLKAQPNYATYSWPNTCFKNINRRLTGVLFIRGSPAQG